MHAVIYARVSSDKQVREGNGISSQIHRCKEYIENKGYLLSQTFEDSGISGKLNERPALKEMLRYLTAHKGTVIVVDAQNRLARDTKVYLLLKESIEKLGCSIEYVSQQFEDSPAGRFIETILAGAAQLERESNQIQVKNRMKARLEQGYWVFGDPTGYTYSKVEGEKLIVPDGVKAPVIKEGFEALISGRFTSQAEVLQFLNKNGVNVTKSAISEILRNPIYTGYLEYPKWGVKLIKAKHKGIITLEQFERVQTKLTKPKYTTDRSEEFPLRGFVECGKCGCLLTSCMSKGRHGGLFPYYYCVNRKCSQYGKTIKRDTIHSETEAILEGIELNDPDFEEMVRDVFVFTVNEMREQYDQSRDQLVREITDIERHIDRILRRITQTDSEMVMETYEKHLAELEKNKLILQEKLEIAKDPAVNIEPLIDLVIIRAKNLKNIWINGSYEEKKMLLSQVFSTKLQYIKNEGYRTPQLSDIYALFSAKNSEKISWCTLAEKVRTLIVAII